MSKLKSAKLILENGKEFVGKSFGFPGSVAGEVVFNTAMTGYPESLTDPSYKGQILVSTYPLIGNYGVPKSDVENNMPKFFESDVIQIAGLVISDYSFVYSHWNAEKSLADWLVENKVPAIFDVDTRALTKILRESGCMLGKIVIDDEDVAWYDPNKENLVDLVSTKEKVVYGNGSNRIMLVDCGVKNNIIRCLLKHDTTVIRVPWNYDFTKDEYDGLFISNGPGDPSMCKETVAHLKTAIEGDKPIFGICLGSQLLGLASGATTYKLKYGHRSHNQPAREVGTNRCFITSQNHGFAVDHSKLTGDWEPYFINLNDDTCEGIKHKVKPIFATQFHPEACGGPTDTEFLFEKFIKLVEENKK
ncbi:MAG: glutamine-hydrolyzing carbamoyl-phosphate synthase small subunit [Bacteroidales bacterium]|nr:glutamine-hydrolyzing carbamoyl-phosphate synthase small subunit [Bacteroidales bacterium]